MSLCGKVSGVPFTKRLTVLFPTVLAVYVLLIVPPDVVPGDPSLIVPDVVPSPYVQLYVSACSAVDVNVTAALSKLSL